MTITDGAVMFGLCLVSFIIGYAVGAFRVTRFVARDLGAVKIELERHREGLEQFYSKLGEEDNK
jgi:hypothetical protein